MQDYLTIINYPNKCASGDRDVCGAANLYVCTGSVSVYHLVYHRQSDGFVIEQCCPRWKEMFSNTKENRSFRSIIIFAKFHYNNICCFVPGDISSLYRQSISFSTEQPPSLPYPPQTTQLQPASYLSIYTCIYISSAPSLIALRKLNINTFNFKIPIKFGFDYYCVIRNQS